MNKKNKGFTTIELITSFTLASVIMLILFNIILILKDNLSKVNAKTNMLVEKDNLSYNINKRFKEKELSSVTMCDEGDKCYEFKYSDDTSDKLVYSNTDKSITFNNYTFDIIDGITVEEPVITEHYDTMSSTKYNGYFIIHIPIKIDNKDYSIKINKHFNTDSMVIDVTKYEYDNEGNRYTLVDYLESTGTQYIDTGVKLNENYKTEIYLQITNKSAQNIFGSRQSATEKNYEIISSVGTDLIVDFYNYKVNRFTKSIPNERFEISISKRKVLIDSKEYAINTYDSFETPQNAYIFNVSGNKNGSSNSWIKLYYLKINEGDLLKRDFIPVLDSKGVACLFDKVEKKCYYNQGTGEFLYG